MTLWALESPWRGLFVELFVGAEVVRAMRYDDSDGTLLFSRAWSWAWLGKLLGTGTTAPDGVPAFAGTYSPCPSTFITFSYLNWA